MLLFLNGLNCPIFTCSVCFGVELNLFIFTTTHQVTSDVFQNMDLGLFFKMMCVLKSISQREVIQILSIWIIPTFYYSFWAIITRSSPIIIISTIDPYFEVSFEKKMSSQDAVMTSFRKLKCIHKGPQSYFFLNGWSWRRFEGCCFCYKVRAALCGLMW